MALSVSIENNESPTSKESPTLTFHSKILPYVIVGLTAGNLSIKINVTLTCHELGKFLKRLLVLELTGLVVIAVG